MTEQQLDGSKISGLAVDLRRFCPPHGMGAVCGAIESCTLYPTIDDAGILPCREMGAVMLAAGKEKTVF
jgi:hypothetical protein